MELITYFANENSLVYRCNVCNKAGVVEGEDINNFKVLNENVCILKEGKEIVCEICGNVHISETPLLPSEESNHIHCPKCGGTQIQLMKRGWKLTTGFIGSSKNERVCLACKHKF